MERRVLCKKKVRNSTTCSCVHSEGTKSEFKEVLPYPSEFGDIVVEELDSAGDLEDQGCTLEVS